MTYCKTLVLAALLLAAPFASATAQQKADNVREKHGDWEIRCTDDSKECVMSQVYRNKDGVPVFEFLVRKLTGEKDAKGKPIKAAAQIITPLNVFLPAGVGVKIDNGQVRGAPFVRCTKVGCFVRAPISSKMLSAMRSGTTATVIVLTRPGEPMKMPLSLKGFTASYKAL